MGRQRKTPAERALDGGANKRTLPTITHDGGEVVCPAYLCAVGRAVWAGMAPMLAKKGLMGPRYQTSFAMYCQTYATFVKAATIVNRKGQTFENKANGMIKQRPEVRIMMDAAREHRHLASEFGAVPGAVGRVAAALLQGELPLPDPHGAHGAGADTGDEHDARHGLH
ncbi:MAG: P27 family phage terminase small subunit [Vicinamibacterales bacterium]